MTTFEENFKDYLKQNIDFEGYEIPLTEPFKDTVSVFMSEKSWQLKRVSKPVAFRDWLQGLPTVINIPFYYHDIRNLLYSLGLDEVMSMDDEQLSNFYYDTVTEIFLSYDR